MTIKSTHNVISKELAPRKSGIGLSESTDATNR